MSDENFVVFAKSQASGPVDYYHATGTILDTNSGFRFENNTLHSPNIEADTVVTRSDKRFKENIKNLSNSLDKLLKLQGKCYTYINDPNKQSHNGYIAQDVQETFPELVKVDEKTGNLYVNYIEMIPIITECIKELHEIITNL